MPYQVAQENWTQTVFSSSNRSIVGKRIPFIETWEVE